MEDSEEARGLETMLIFSKHIYICEIRIAISKILKIQYEKKPYGIIIC